jgi:uncharacterized zinc-type alcohol dehydrogenase-like protein
MLDFAGKQGIGANVEVIRMQDINKAFDMTVSGEVKYRFVIDMNSLRGGS